jgi:tetratricopeptide (TPR) repeat protein
MGVKLDLGVARCVGRNDFDGAVRLLEEALAGSPNADDMTMLATCHRWAGRPEMAIQTAERALDLDATSFNAIQLLSELHAERKDYATAARFARLGLEQFPEPLAASPRVFQWVLSAMVALVPRMREIEASTRQTLDDPSASSRKWYEWATAYLAWYDQTCAKQSNPAAD